jgi:hypothetical protein
MSDAVKQVAKWPEWKKQALIVRWENSKKQYINEYMGCQNE